VASAVRAGRNPASPGELNRKKRGAVANALDAEDLKRQLKEAADLA
jgi:hypothetical protein